MYSTLLHSRTQHTDPHYRREESPTTLSSAEATATVVNAAGLATLSRKTINNKGTIVLPHNHSAHKLLYHSYHQYWKLLSVCLLVIMVLLFFLIIEQSQQVVDCHCPVTSLLHSSSIFSGVSSSSSIYRNMNLHQDGTENDKRIHGSRMNAVVSLVDNTTTARGTTTVQSNPSSSLVDTFVTEIPLSSSTIIEHEKKKECTTTPHNHLRGDTPPPTHTDILSTTHQTESSSSVSSPSVPTSFHPSSSCCVGEGERQVCWQRSSFGRPYRILFHSNQLGLRGTEIGLYDYARYFEELACGEAYIATNFGTTSLETLPKFEARFPRRIHFLPRPADLSVRTIDTSNTHNNTNVSKPVPSPSLSPIEIGYDYENTVLKRLIRRFEIDALFTIQPDTYPPSYLRPQQGIKYLIQGVFSGRGIYPNPADAVVVVGDAVPREPNVKVVPRIVHFDYPPQSLTSMRKDFNIPVDSRVFCRHGDVRTFNIQSAKDDLCRFAQSHSNQFFMLMNTEPLTCTAKNIVYVTGSYESQYKQRFLASCNACIHARIDGETFGMAIAECSLAGLPVFTHYNSGAKNHLLLLDNYAILYGEKHSLYDRLVEFNATDALLKREDYKQLYRKYSPANVMLDFLQNLNILGDVIGTTMIGKPL